ncbi:Kynureninase (L-kynurenine hydrolase) [Pseudogymnoascus destructans]|uniref:Kynureninase n=1 Tax=Pseudogymnoascus destructans TaxID=655981 RepID=A0A177A8U0_9PEZI|nr:Kynureninase (L-kynurenine hydrolase) [Pseudogymnoascus destructans]OAF58140.2 Kynureninase (L-kynurenine hydrolase) [Pseudogymnoascus destructans]
MTESTPTSTTTNGQATAADALPHHSREYAEYLTAQDPLKHLRAEFFIPSKADLARETLPRNDHTIPPSSHDESVYLCGNSLGLQPRRVSQRLQQYLSAWATQGVQGHFKALKDSPLPAWLYADDAAAKAMAPIVGAAPAEIAVMETLTANLHFILSAFYRPDVNGRHKIIIESKAFPSDHFAVESQVRHHNLPPSTSMITIDPPTDTSLLPTSHILATIDAHASTTAVLLLPGVQFYTGQLLDIKTITAYAQARGIFVVWDLAHAVGNVPLQLHDWNVDAAAWCTYKYLNSGPGAIGGMFVHERNSRVTTTTTTTTSNGATNGDKKSEDKEFHPRLAGWWGSDKKTRFAMSNDFSPIPGAGGFQVSNPSTNDLTTVCASLEVFNLTTIAELREKSLGLTAYLEERLLALQKRSGGFKIITPSSPEERGAQLSVQLEEGFLEGVMEELIKGGVIVDERMPDVIRVAPAPIYNNAVDVWIFMDVFEKVVTN